VAYCNYSDGNSAECFLAEYNSVECHVAFCNYSDGNSVECRVAECHSA
jgi:hypothetical protein